LDSIADDLPVLPDTASAAVVQEITAARIKSTDSLSFIVEGVAD
jgi:hypothetical protein